MKSIIEITKNLLCGAEYVRHLVNISAKFLPMQFKIVHQKYSVCVKE